MTHYKDYIARGDKAKLVGLGYLGPVGRSLFHTKNQAGGTWTSRSNIVDSGRPRSFAHLRLAGSGNVNRMLGHPRGLYCTAEVILKLTMGLGKVQ